MNTQVMGVGSYGVGEKKLLDMILGGEFNRFLCVCAFMSACFIPW